MKISAMNLFRGKRAFQLINLNKNNPIQSRNMDQWLSSIVAAEVNSKGWDKRPGVFMENPPHGNQINRSYKFPKFRISLFIHLMW